MSIVYNEEQRIFSLTTAHHLYQMQVAEGGVLLHLYYGPITGADMSYLVRMADRGFSGNPYEQRSNRGFSLDTLPQEYACSGVGDYRAPAVRAVSENGSRSTDLRYQGYRTEKKRVPLPGLPFVREAEDTETLVITMKDEVTGLEAELFWHVFPSSDVISRSVRLINAGSAPITLEKAASFSLDFSYGQYDVIHFHGRHCMERTAERLHLPHTQVSFGSERGMSSHHHNPFVILCDRTASENQGGCWGFMLMYSGGHLEEIEVSQTGSVRVVAGLQPEGFSWRLNPGEDFYTPEAILTCSSEGLNGLSRNLHRIIREHVIDPRYSAAYRPVLLNSWEAAYFHFNAEKLLQFARSASTLGMEMLVLDDGWFGSRDNDLSGLGDWVVNEGKLGCSMKELSEQVHALGLKFGLWFEPEMVNEDSDLFRAHPDWALSDPGRKPTMARNQLVLDMSRQEVVDYLFEAMCDVLDKARIEYVKWDFNRSIANCFSHALPADRQGEVAHRFSLGTYQLLSRLLSRYPDLMIEGCSGGGGRFDAGMLFYCPQIWCSDDTDPIERLDIQRGTSYGYPVSTMGAHVSASPNHQTGRSTPLHTRGVVAQSGTFGYEMNVNHLTEEEKQEIRGQITGYRRFAELIAHGDYYRLNELEDMAECSAWMFVSPDRKEALVSMVMTHLRANGPFPWFRLQGLMPDGVYALEVTDPRGTEMQSAGCVTGAALMQGGYAFPYAWGDYRAMQLHLTRVN